MTGRPKVLFALTFLPSLRRAPDMAAIGDLDRLRSKRRRIVSTASSSLPVTNASARNDQPAGLGESSSTSREGQQERGEVAMDSRDWSSHLACGRRLDVVFVGHNPSSESWSVCAPYAHGSNRFWKLLGETGLVEEQWCVPEHHAELPRRCAVGFIDLFVTDGSDASKVRPDAAKNDDWRQDFINRLDRSRDGGAQSAPRVLAVISKVVAKKLLKGWKGRNFGDVGPARDWTEAGLQEFGDMRVWVLPSSSGRAVISWEERSKPFQELGCYIRSTEDAVVKQEGRLANSQETLSNTEQQLL